jgi:hypothetical protein
MWGSELLQADRRTMLRHGAAGLFLFTLGGCDVLMSPDEARKRGASIRHLSEQETETLEAFGEALVPGARNAGIAHYVDANLQRPHADNLLTVRYLDVLPPYLDFYAEGLKALDETSQTAMGKTFAELGEKDAARIIRPMLGGSIEGWKGPPAPLFYLAVRSDAADLVYGTVASFERMGLPYMPHIEPPSPW